MFLCCSCQRACHSFTVASPVERKRKQVNKETAAGRFRTELCICLTCCYSTPLPFSVWNVVALGAPSSISPPPPLPVSILHPGRSWSICMSTCQQGRKLSLSQNNKDRSRLARSCKWRHSHTWCVHAYVCLQHLLGPFNSSIPSEYHYHFQCWLSKVCKYTGWAFSREPVYYLHMLLSLMQ